MTLFDGLYFDGAVFDIGATVTDRPSIAHPTRGGWVKKAPVETLWGPNDQGRGSEWTARPKGTGFN